MNLSSVGRKGFLDLLLIVVTSRASAFAAQWVMGIFLVKEDFGVIAIVSIIYLLASGFREVGLYQVLQEHRADFEQVAPDLTASAQILNLTGVALLLCAAPFLAHYYSDPRLVWITVLLALVMPFNIAALPYKARLAIGFDFRKISRIESASILASNLSMALLASAGAGVYSFVVSQIVLTMAAYGMYRRGQSSLGGTIFPAAPSFRRFMSRSKWLIVSSYMSNIATRGDYLVLSLLVGKAALGLYYFAYQLMAAAVQLVGMALNHLLLPLFSAIRDDTARVKSGLEKAGDALSLMTGALCLSLLVWFPFIIHTVWSGKWDEAIPLTLMVTLAVPPRLLSSPLGSSALEAMAQYRTRTVISVIDAASLVVFIWVGATVDGIEGACAAMAIQRSTTGMLFYFAAARHVGIALSQAGLQLAKHLMPYAVSCAALAIFISAIKYERFVTLGFVGTALLYVPLMITFAILSHRQIAQHVLKK